MSVLLNHLDLLVPQLQLCFQVLDFLVKGVHAQLSLPLCFGLQSRQFSRALRIRVGELAAAPQRLVGYERLDVGLVEGEARHGFAPFIFGLGVAGVHWTRRSRCPFVCSDVFGQYPLAFTRPFQMVGLARDDALGALLGLARVSNSVKLGLLCFDGFGLLHDIK